LFEWACSIWAYYGVTTADLGNADVDLFAILERFYVPSLCIDPRGSILTELAELGCGPVLSKSKKRLYFANLGRIYWQISVRVFLWRPELGDIGARGIEQQTNSFK
jgi:hypothetical protein